MTPVWADAEFRLSTEPPGVVPEEGIDKFVAIEAIVSLEDPTN